MPTKQPFHTTISRNDVKKSPNALDLEKFRHVRFFFYLTIKLYRQFTVVKNLMVAMVFFFSLRNP